jgi:hypothetical protein
MKKYIIAILGLFLMIACGDKPSRTQAFAFNNSTLHSIKITPFKNGNMVVERMLDLKPTSLLVIDTISGPANRDTPPKFYPFFDGFDSVQVYFDNQKLITHLLLPGATSGNKYYTTASPRNFNNPQCATIVKPEWVWEITYTFTEQDYLDASQ